MGDEIQLMQDGVWEWIQQAARRGKSRLHTASPKVLLSPPCASALGSDTFMTVLIAATEIVNNLNVNRPKFDVRSVGSGVGAIDLTPNIP
jgi:hypothetical protein